MYWPLGSVQIVPGTHISVDCAGKLKQECTVLVVSHDLRELEPLIDVAWEMEPGGKLNPVQWPPTKA